MVVRLPASTSQASFPLQHLGKSSGDSRWNFHRMAERARNPYPLEIDFEVRWSFSNLEHSARKYFLNSDDEELELKASLLKDAAISGDLNLICKELFSLAESTGLLKLCASINDHVLVTEDNVSSWLKWLAEEHDSNTHRILANVKEVVKRAFKRMRFWADATVDQLASLDKVVKQKKRKDSRKRRRMRS
ncbi:hypothetical protein KFL_000010630 [Klebsormidium nitens]|uniref:Uncharacterized protein n=1 Tax=Klebsormidium nitens TaxID=105231 RepID=A0A0U9HI33_KLENI|nr:hypothetical protein KFL_000010630 [Klebsormidium nitens]|eukprot:GAQ77614.1 hypothetical protein KFL_000010630 [Klebsormidium nitens]